DDFVSVWSHASPIFFDIPELHIDNYNMLCKKAGELGLSVYAEGEKVFVLGKSLDYCLVQNEGITNPTPTKNTEIKNVGIGFATSSYGNYVLFSPDKRYLPLVKEWIKMGIKSE
ncbi:MAG: hypothetical protein HZB68_04085, partial [Candidatus Aenigmarchaeota archaeon]|nr:hypothetical protein [Candidatus Aenigmarchaeota archaeon]